MSNDTEAEKILRMIETKRALRFIDAIKKQEVVTHFKGDKYKLLHLAKVEATKEQVIVYQAMYGNNEIYTRPFSEFISLRDKEKYPQYDQEHRFALESDKPKLTAKEKAELTSAALEKRKKQKDFRKRQLQHEADSHTFDNIQKVKRRCK